MEGALAPFASGCLVHWVFAVPGADPSTMHDRFCVVPLIALSRFARVWTQSHRAHLREVEPVCSFSFHQHSVASAIWVGQTAGELWSPVVLLRLSEGFDTKLHALSLQLHLDQFRSDSQFAHRPFADAQRLRRRPSVAQQGQQSPLQHDWRAGTHPALVGSWRGGFLISQLPVDRQSFGSCSLPLWRRVAPRGCSHHDLDHVGCCQASIRCTCAITRTVPCLTSIRSCGIVAVSPFP